MYFLFVLIKHLYKYCRIKNCYLPYDVILRSLCADIYSNTNNYHFIVYRPTNNARFAGISITSNYGIVIPVLIIL